MQKLYLANQFGFSETGKLFLLHAIIPRLENSFIVVEPFRECGIIKKTAFSDNTKKILDKNRRLMMQCHIMAAILDGGHQIDDGTAAEIAEFSIKKLGPVIALRTDLRRYDKDFMINPQVEKYILDSGGKICSSLKKWFEELRKLA